MSDWKLNLVVLRVADLAAAAKFYELFGLTFTAEKHGRGPEHLAAESQGVVLELYPRGSSRSTSDVRLGFQVANLNDIVAAVPACGGVVLSAPETGFQNLGAVVADPDGHRIELVERISD